MMVIAQLYFLFMLPKSYSFSFKRYEQRKQHDKKIKDNKENNSHLIATYCIIVNLG